MTRQDLRKLADQVKVKDGGMWPINPLSGSPICDRCNQDATRVEWSRPYDDVQGATFFCPACDVHDDADFDAPLVRMENDPNARKE